MHIVHWKTVAAGKADCNLVAGRMQLLAQRGIIVTPESVRLCSIKFGGLYARRLSRWRRGYDDNFRIEEVFARINGKQRHLWRDFSNPQYGTFQE